MAKREIQEINAGSMADIAFLLLIFFLVSTTMDTDKGILRMLPPIIPESEQQEIDINTRNILTVNVNKDNHIQVYGSQMINISELRDIAKNFIKGESQYGAMAPEMKTVNLKECGFPIELATEHIIQLKNDRGTSYKTYIQVQNELTAAYTDLRNEFVREYFGVETMDQLADEKIKKEIEEEVYPRKISESDPVNVGGN
jgi:biopolymer transport protein ExbD